MQVQLQKQTVAALVAVVVSSLLFTIVHIPTKDWAELQGILLSSVVMGYIYYWTGSSLLLMGYHVLSNTCSAHGIWGVTIVVAVYLLIVLATREEMGR